MIRALYILALAAWIFPAHAGEIVGTVHPPNGQVLKTPLSATLIQFVRGSPTKESRSASVDAGGRFRFENTPFDPTVGYVVQVQHDGLSFFSPLIHGRKSDRRVSTEVRLLSSVPSSDSVKLSDYHVMISRNKRARGFLNIVTSAEYHHHGTAVVRPKPKDDGGIPSVRIPLFAPREDLTISFEIEDSEIAVDSDGIKIYSTIYPGTQSYVSSYRVSYTFQSIALPLPIDKIPIAENGTVRVMLEEGLALASHPPLLTPPGRKFFEGAGYVIYTFSSANAPSILTLTGLPLNFPWRTLGFPAGILLILLVMCAVSRLRPNIAEEPIDRTREIQSLLTSEQKLLRGELDANEYRLKREATFRKLIGSGSAH